VTSNERRAGVLVRALESRFVRGAEAHELFTEDLRVWTPTFNARSLAELTAETSALETAFSDVDLDVRALDVGGDYACAEWVLSATHSGPFSLGEGRRALPTGRRLTLVGATVAEFDGELICSLRHYWDELALIEQLGA
jgi:SnoaL-like polyketide cyclase